MPRGQATLAETTEPAQTPAAAPQIRIVPVKDITTSPDNTRLFEKKDKEEKIALEELAASIAELGVQQPPKVRTSDDETGPRYILVYGERRLRAVRDVLKWSMIPVIIDDTMNRKTSAAATVVENMQRRDLHPMDEAKGIAILRSQATTIKEIAAQLGRREEWVKERLKLCELPGRVQDLYRHSQRMTLQEALLLHGFMHGGKDDRGFPSLVVTLAEGLDAGKVVVVNGSLSLHDLSYDHPELVQQIAHAYSDQNGYWGANYFDTKKTCLKCPFAAYRPGHWDNSGFCLLPSHYKELQAKGKEKYDAAQAQAAAEATERGEEPPAPKTSWQREAEKTPSQKGKETRERHKRQAANYAPTVTAIEHAMTMIANVDGVDLAVLAAYTLMHSHVDSEAIEQMKTRHGLKSFPDVMLSHCPSTEMIEQLRKLEPVDIIRYTLEALLLTQARRERDYDPGRTHGDPVLALYCPTVVHGDKE